ncbi:hypothetical protein PIB30_035990 [Stylosanthes scabra]|uniref:Uncharacterized protein n=1 Tax=Stylosanthes scabra TaxID=79078 RepID=A0ABU6UF58_9FABA|nr:hypothetical protein [Stylosanthes scabra]
MYPRIRSADPPVHTTHHNKAPNPQIPLLSALLSLVTPPTLPSFIITTSPFLPLFPIIISLFLYFVATTCVAAGSRWLSYPRRRSPCVAAVCARRLHLTCILYVSTSPNQCTPNHCLCALCLQSPPPRNRTGLSNKPNIGPEQEKEISVRVIATQIPHFRFTSLTSPAQTQGGEERSLRLLLNLKNGCARSGFVKMSATCLMNKIIGEVDGKKIVAEDGWESITRLLHLEEKVLDPLHFCKRGSEGSIFCLDGDATHGGQLRALPQDQIGAKKDTIVGAKSSVVRITC